MTKKTFTEALGPNATQDLAEFNLAKSDYTDESLTPAANNSPGSLLVALLRRLEGIYTRSHIDANPDENIFIERGFPQFLVKNNIRYEQMQYVVNVHIATPEQEPDPDLV